MALARLKGIMARPTPTLELIGDGRLGCMHQAGSTPDLKNVASHALASYAV